MNDYVLGKIEEFKKQENYTLNSQNQLAYSFTPDELNDYNKVFARCKVMLHLFDFTLDRHEQDILDEYGPALGQTLEDNRTNMHALLELGEQWIIKTESNNYDVDLEVTRTWIVMQIWIWIRM